MPETPRPMPRRRAPDSTLALRADPYRFISTECARLDTDVFEARLLLERTICMSGADAAAVFYDGERMQRANAAPEPLRATLFGKGAVQGLDDAAHRARKALFVAALDAAHVAALAHELRRQWHDQALRWRAGHPVCLYTQAQTVLARAACGWAGLPWSQHEADAHAADLVVLFDGAARTARSHVHARLARRRLERTLARLVEDVRAGRRAAAADAALARVAAHRDADGAPLSPRIAAVELLNVVRPVIAVSVYLVFTALALRQRGEARARVRTGDAAYVHGFLQEVRRHFPFFPAVAARVRRDFQWNGFAFPKGRRVLLDLYGINHDPRIWEQPQRFDPGRFAARTPTLHEFVPQGGATVAGHHRCPGEDATMALMGVTLEWLAQSDCAIEAPGGGDIDMRRIPALPRAGLFLRPGAAPA